RFVIVRVVHAQLAHGPVRDVGDRTGRGRATGVFAQVHEAVARVIGRLANVAEAIPDDYFEGGVVVGRAGDLGHVGQVRRIVGAILVRDAAQEFESGRVVLVSELVRDLPLGIGNVKQEMVLGVIGETR